MSPRKQGPGVSHPCHNGHLALFPNADENRGVTPVTQRTSHGHQARRWNPNSYTHNTMVSTLPSPGRGSRVTNHEPRTTNHEPRTTNHEPVFHVKHPSSREGRRGRFTLSRAHKHSRLLRSVSRETIDPKRRTSVRVPPPLICARGARTPRVGSETTPAPNSRPSTSTSRCERISFSATVISWETEAPFIIKSSPSRRTSCAVSGISVRNALTARAVTASNSPTFRSSARARRTVTFDSSRWKTCSV